MTKPFVAVKTMEAIEEAMASDQGAHFRTLLRDLLPLQEDGYRGEEESFRAHLGASIIGRDCSRELWYSFRWTTRKDFPGYVLRLFNRGHLEEARFVSLLMIIGCKVWQFDENGEQFRLKGHRGHYAGGLDSVLKGLPEMPDENVLGEYKTHNDKSFTKLVKVGVREAKPEHYAQMNQYMGYYDLQWALYLAVNKNDDKLYAELVPFDATNYGQHQMRAAFIIDSPTPPPKISNSPGWWKCKFCDHKEVCHGSDEADLNCRTCAWAQVADEGRWLCTHPENYVEGGCWLSKQDQLSGCGHYEANPTIKG